jgi:Bacterial Ig-like domain
MTNTQTTTKKTNRYFGAVLLALAAMALAVLLAGGTAMAATTLYHNGSPIQIADNGPANPYPSKTSVQFLPGNITDVNVALYGYSHTFPDDVGVLLVGPQGQKALLMSDVGGSNAVNDVNVGFDDESSLSLPDEGQITDGIYKPTQGTAIGGPGFPVDPPFPAPAPAPSYADNLSVFDGTDPNGTWDLYVVDDTGQDVGQIARGWDLFITTDGPPPDTTAPRVKITVPQPAATGVSPTANVKAAFSEGMTISTVNATTFKLFRKGSTTKVAATVTFDGTADRNTATLDPANPLKRGATYKAVVTTGAKDQVGNRLDQNPNLSGLQPKVWTFKVSN